MNFKRGGYFTWIHQIVFYNIFHTVFMLDCGFQLFLRSIETNFSDLTNNDRPRWILCVGSYGKIIKFDPCLCGCYSNITCTTLFFKSPVFSLSHFLQNLDLPQTIFVGFLKVRFKLKYNKLNTFPMTSLHNELKHSWVSHSSV